MEFTVVVLVLQIIVSVAFFAQKAFLLAGKKSNWLIGALTAIVGVIYFYLVNMYIYSALDCGLIILMAYGFFKKEKKNPTIEMFIRITVAIIMTVLLFAAFAGIIGVLEFISSLGLMFGTYWLTHKKVKIGWIAYITAHIFGIIVGYSHNQITFADFQIASAIVCFAGLSIAISKK